MVESPIKCSMLKHCVLRERWFVENEVKKKMKKGMSWIVIMYLSFSLSQEVKRKFGSSLCRFLFGILAVIFDWLCECNCLTSYKEQLIPGVLHIRFHQLESMSENVYI